MIRRAPEFLVNGVLGPVEGLTFSIPCPPPPCRRFCITVVPRQGNESNIYTFRGRGWAPRREVRVVFAPYCREAVCLAYLKGAHVVTTDKGKFFFRYRIQPEPPSGISLPYATGEGAPYFDQLVPCPGLKRNRFVRRVPVFKVNGLVPDPPQRARSQSTRCPK